VAAFLPVLARLLGELGLARDDSDGCYFGLATEEGKPIKKPWRVMTNGNAIWQALSGQMCPKAADHRRHQPCEGKCTDNKARRSSCQPKDEHRRRQAIGRQVRPTSDGLGSAPTMPCVDEQHRSHIRLPLFNAFVRKLLKKSEVADKTAAKAALFKELEGLRHQGAWGDDCVRE